MEMIFFVIVLLLSVIIHEYSHGIVAYAQGDPTAKFAGRLTLNPIPHIDLLGTIVIPLLLVLTKAGFLIGWAKPVPYNPYNLKNQRFGPALVGAAGPASNFLLALIFSIIIFFIPEQIDNLKIFLGIIVYVNVVFGVFNLFPIPPLDGSKVLFSLLPSSLINFQYFLERFGFLILIALILYGGKIIGYPIFLLVFIFLGQDLSIAVLDALLS